MSPLLRALPVGLLLSAGGAQARPQDPLDLHEVAWDADLVIEEHDEGPTELTDLSLEALMDIDVEVTSASRKSQSLEDVAAAVYVITAEDIRRTGARSIPEALRLAPGIRVARTSAGRYAVAARGFTWIYSDKLLVMVDGRSAYSPRFSGTEWETIDLPVEDIERIEVIRGPGGTMWGSNAVNGVVNIITKKARDVQGRTITVVAGTEERFDVQVRGGTRLGQSGFLRAFARMNERDATGGNSTDIEDGLAQTRFGARADFDLDERTELTVQTDAYSVLTNVGNTFVIDQPPFFRQADDDRRTNGAVLFGRWTRRHRSGTTSTLQATYAGYDTASEVVDENRNQVDLWFQRQHQLGNRNELVWGVSFRYTQVNFRNTPVLEWTGNRNDQLYAGFVQDEYSATDDLRFTLGAKLEHNVHTGLEVQPSLRGLYRISDGSSAWAAVSRAVQTPAEVYRGARVLYGFVPDPGVGYDTQIVLNPTGWSVPESVVAYEAGFRTGLTERLSLDIAAFYNDYDNVASITFGQPFPVTPTLVEQPFTADGATQAQSFGVEVASRYLVSAALTLHVGYSYLRIREQPGPTVVPWDFDVETPKHLAHARAYYDVSDAWELDAALYYMSERGGDPTFEEQLRADLRLGWRPTDDLTLSLVGQGLFHDGDMELRPDFGGDQHAFDAGVYLSATARL
ncbi:MAG: TonB-dependent receptor [Planctomycetota bacterium]